MLIKATDLDVPRNSLFWISKRLVDLIISSLLIPVLIIVTLILVCFNFFYDKGPVFFIQKRMGKNCIPFYAIKFRTMVKTDVISRKYFDPLELDRITRAGHFLRKLRMDELPQILNVIRNEMSLIGPRPDYYEHAIQFLKTVPYYRERHIIKPGISGLSQIRLGYAEGIDATKKKSRCDIYYIKNASIYLDIKIFLGTILTIIKSIGA